MNISLLATISALLGGIGLFLMGMILMSDGLKSAAGPALQGILRRATGTPVAAFLSGVGLTALVQSSSATTIMIIGFVSAGLLPFANAIGVIIGANVGTTSTGWIVSLLGFKLNVGAVSLPLIGAGALMRLFSSGRRAHLGMALAGFGLIFIGIDFLQTSMGELALRLDLSAFPAATLGGRLALVLVGSLLTVLLQSSSAAVAVTLTALYSGAINLNQAAFLVIGQNLGTTVKAGLASIGASVPAKRTAVAHILFNAVTALIALLAADYLLSLIAVISNSLDDAGPATQIALFHTAFNLMGALIFLPLIRPFARLVSRLLPDRGPAFTRHLDKSLLTIPMVALQTAAQALREISAATLDEAARLLSGQPLRRQGREELLAAQAAMTETSDFLGSVQMADGEGNAYIRRLHLLHASDHLQRLIEACLEFEEPVRGAEVQQAGHSLAAELQQAGHSLAAELQQASLWLHKAGPSWMQGKRAGSQPSGKDEEDYEMAQRLAAASLHQADVRRNHRTWLLEETAAGRVSPVETQHRLESMRWVDRIAYHTWRTIHHLVGISTPETSRFSETYIESEAGMT